MALLRRVPLHDSTRETGYEVDSPLNLAQFEAELGKALLFDGLSISVIGDARNASEKSPAILLVGPRSVREEIVLEVARAHQPDWGWKR